MDSPNTNPETGFSSRLDFSRLQQAVHDVRTQVGKIIVGQERMLDLLLAALLASGHVLIEGVPGVAKTLTAKLLARTVRAQFNRIQFTPDLMPSDVLGTNIFNQQTQQFEFRKGPIFTNLVLIDEINRSPAKTQAALFEVMEERQVTVDGHTYKMAPPFMVLATQNPIEHEGTYRLPEAQLDRFLFLVEVGYPSLEDEAKILQGFHTRLGINDPNSIEPVITGDELVGFQKLVQQVRIEAPLIKYIAEIVHTTRNDHSLYLGASPRASLALLQGGKAFAAMNGRDFVTPDDIHAVAYPVLRHRIILTPEREMEGVRPQNVIERIIEQIEVPR